MHKVGPPKEDHSKYEMPSFGNKPGVGFVC